MLVLRNSSIALLFVTLGLPVLAQSQEMPQSNPTAVSPERHRGTPCWRQAGITADMVNKRWHIEDQQRVRIAQVCAEATTSAQQKRDKIEQIHSETNLAVRDLIPAQELAAFNKCQAELDQRHPKPAGEKELGPCGGVIPKSASDDAMSAPDHRHNK